MMQRKRGVRGEPSDSLGGGFYYEPDEPDPTEQLDDLETGLIDAEPMDDCTCAACRRGRHSPTQAAPGVTRCTLPLVARPGDSGDLSVGTRLSTHIRASML
jgi:hypothetical protein